jgi:translocation and assembly module TamA
MITLPAAGTWDFRDDELNATSGSYVSARVTPFAGIGSTASGLRAELDARSYRALGGDGDVVLAGRLQLGAVFGPSLAQTRSDYLFFSGGGGTVRGQPYQSLNIDLGAGTEVGGRSFLGLSGEIRIPISGPIGAVAFVDAGYIGAESFVDGSGDWHSGAGLGLRYQTGLGPIRLDVAAPVSGRTGDGVQLYIGIGQAF